MGKCVDGPLRLSRAPAAERCEAGRTPPRPSWRPRRAGAGGGEMGRVLRPGGALWLALHPFSLVWNELRTSVERRRWRAALHRLYALANGIAVHLTGRELPAPYRGKHHSFQTGARIVRMLEGLGFENIRVEQGRFFVVTATRKRK